MVKPVRSAELAVVTELPTTALLCPQRQTSDAFSCPSRHERCAKPHQHQAAPLCLYSAACTNDPCHGAPSPGAPPTYKATSIAHPQLGAWHYGHPCGAVRNGPSSKNLQLTQASTDLDFSWVFLWDSAATTCRQACTDSVHISISPAPAQSASQQPAWHARQLLALPRPPGPA